MNNKIAAKRGCEVEKVDNYKQEGDVTIVPNSVNYLDDTKGCNVALPDVHHPDLSKIVNDEVK
jgi:hypothetical protein